MAEDHYRTLNVTPNATIDEIQRAYRALARRFHPDRNRLPHASTVMAGINEAYDVLGEPSKRAAYDRGHGKHDNRIDEAIMQGAVRHSAQTGLDGLWKLRTGLHPKKGISSGLRYGRVGSERVHVAAVDQTRGWVSRCACRPY